MNKISWHDSYWFFDIDDTLIDTAGTSEAASEGIFNVFSSSYPEEKAREVQRNFNNIFELMLAGYRVKHEDDWQKATGGKDAFDDLFSYIEGHQLRIKEKWGHVKKFSREVFIKRAAEQASITPPAELIHEAADAFWITLSEKTIIFDDALHLIKAIREHDRPVYLATGSDARLRLAADGQFDYDAEYSEALKRERIEIMRARGLQYNTLSIGDPEDKPHLDFFQKMIKTAELNLNQSIDTSKAIMVGDSFGGDLKTPKEQMGFGLVVLLDKECDGLEVVDDGHLRTNDLTKLVSYLDSQ